MSKENTNAQKGVGTSSTSRLSTGFKLKVMEPKEFSGCSSYGEDVGSEALSWLKKVERIKVTGKLSDEETLFFIGDYLVKKAETWYNVVGSKATTWAGFVTLFKKQYLVDQEDKWWSELQNMKQSKNDTIDDVALKMEELFILLENKNEAYQVRTFLSAINKKIAFEVEKDGTPLTFDEAKTKAKQIDKSLKKYEMKNGVDSLGFTQQDEKFYEVSDERTSYLENRSEVSSLVAKLEQLSINLVKLSETVTKGSNGSSGFTAAPKNFPRTLVCFNCGEAGHKKWDCPILVKEENTRQAAGTGANAIPIGNSRSIEDSGKDKEHQL